MNIYRNRAKLLLFGFVILLFLAGGLFMKSNSMVGAETAKEKCFKSVEIKKGDTLWSIAKENMSGEYSSVNKYVDEVCETNHITSDEITEGMYIVVPYYTAKKA